MLAPVFAVLVAGLSAQWLTVVASKRASPERDPGCWCPFVAAMLGAGTAVAAVFTESHVALAAAVPCAVIAGVDLHCQRAPHEMTATAAAAVGLAAWPDVLGWEPLSEFVLLPASIALIAVASYIVKESPSVALWPLFSYAFLALLAWWAFNDPPLALPPLAGLFLALLTAGAGAAAKRLGRPGVGGGDLALFAVALTAASWPTTKQGDNSWWEALHYANREWMAFTVAAAIVAVIVALVLNKRLAGAVPAAPSMSAGLLAAAAISVV